MKLLRLAAVRIATGALTLFVVSVAVFIAMSALPGNAATVALGQTATPAAVATLTRQFGLDRPLISRYLSWLSGMMRGQLGHSLPTGVSVAGLIGNRLVDSGILALATMIVLVPVGMAIGVASATHPDSWWDRLIGSSTLVLIAAPSFVLGTILIVIFAFWLHLLPAVSLVNQGSPVTFSVLVLPVLTLLGASIAQTIRMIRASMVDVLQSPYIEKARLQGASEERVLWLHAVPNALGPTVQILALNIPWLVGDIVIVEVLFGFQGLGTALVGGVTERDLPTVEAIVMIIAALIVVCNLLADLLLIATNPRLRRGA